MNKRTLIAFLLVALVASLARAETVLIRLPNEATNILNALLALDGTERVLLDTSTGTERVVKTPFDFGKDAIRIRMTIRKNIIALRDALDAYEQTRLGHCRDVFGVDSLTPDAYLKQPEEKREAFGKKMATLMAPAPVEVALFTDKDVEQFAQAAIPGSTSVALDPLVKKADKKGI